jgi:hypothetical protein
LHNSLSHLLSALESTVHTAQYDPPKIEPTDSHIRRHQSIIYLFQHTTKSDIFHFSYQSMKTSRHKWKLHLDTEKEENLVYVVLTYKIEHKYRHILLSELAVYSKT